MGWAMDIQFWKLEILTTQLLLLLLLLRWGLKCENSNCNVWNHHFTLRSTWYCVWCCIPFFISSRILYWFTVIHYHSSICRSARLASRWESIWNGNDLLESTPSIETFSADGLSRPVWHTHYWKSVELIWNVLKCSHIPRYLLTKKCSLFSRVMSQWRRFPEGRNLEIVAAAAK